MALRGPAWSPPTGHVAVSCGPFLAGFGAGSAIQVRRTTTTSRGANVTKIRAISICGYVGMSCSVLLAVATGWAHSNYHSALRAISQSLHETTQSAATVLDQAANTTRARADVAENTVQVLRSSRKLVQDLKFATEKQGAMLPQYAANVKDIAASAYGAAGSMCVVANALAVQFPVGVERQGILPAIVWGAPFADSVKELRIFAQRSASLGVSLDALAASLNGEALTISTSFVDNCNQTLRFIDSWEKLAATVRDEHMPQAIAAMTRTKATLAEVGGQAERVNQIGYALLFIGLLLATVGGALSFAALRTATVLEGGKP